MAGELKIAYDLGVEDLERTLTVYAEAAPHRDKEPNWRDATKFDFTECPHTQATHLLVENPLGTWELVICVRCAHVIQTECHHTRMEWFADGRVLVCRNCGKDGT